MNDAPANAPTGLTGDEAQRRLAKAGPNATGVRLLMDGSELRGYVTC